MRNLSDKVFLEKENASLIYEIDSIEKKIVVTKQLTFKMKPTQASLKKRFCDLQFI